MDLLLLAVFVIWYMLVFLLTIHEYGHLMAMKRLGINADRVVIGSYRLFSFKLHGIVHDIGLFPILGYCLSKEYEKASARDRALVAAAGPLATALTGAIFYAIDYVNPGWPVHVAAYGSLVFFFTNLIPLPPLDGWTILEVGLVKRGIKITESRRKQLFIAGMAAAVLVAFFV